MGKYNFEDFNPFDIEVEPEETQRPNRYKSKHSGSPRGTSRRRSRPENRPRSEGRSRQAQRPSGQSRPQYGRSRRKPKNAFARYSIHIAAGVIVLVLVLVIVIIFNTCTYQGNTNGMQNSTSETGGTADPQSTQQNQQDHIIAITISGTAITCNGKTVDSLEQLETLLQSELTDDTFVSLIDDSADPDTHTGVTNLLARLGYAISG